MSEQKVKSPLLSVVVPVYKTEHYLDACMESVLGQTFKDMEIILVDDGSPDRCPEMCERWALKDPRIRVVHKENQGLGYARNTGIEHARGTYVTFLDSDDLIEPQTYAEAMAQMGLHDADMVRFMCNRFDDMGQSGPESYDKPPVIFDNPEDIRKLALCIFDTPFRGMERYDLGGSSCMAIYRLDILKRHNIRFESEREYISEDYLFNFEYYHHCSRVVWLERTYYHYRITLGSLTRKLNLNVMDRVEKYSRHVEETLAAAGYAAEASVYASGYYVRVMRYYLHRVFLSRSLSMAEKRRWFYERASDPYFRRVCSLYPWRNLPFKQRLLFSFLDNKRFIPSWLLAVGYSKLRSDKLK